MSDCCQGDVKAVHTVIGNNVTSQYFDLRSNPPVQITQADYDALDKVKCPVTTTDMENICLQEVGNTDAANIVKGMRCVLKTTKFADTAGTVEAVTIDGVNLHLADGTDVTATHEEVACPVPTIIETGACVKA